MENDSEIQSALMSYGHMDKLSRVYEYEGWRNLERLVIRILDSGPDCDNPRVRYTCVVTKGGGTPEVTGNPQESIAAAIAAVHWFRFDSAQ